MLLPVCEAFAETNTGPKSVEMSGTIQGLSSSSLVWQTKLFLMGSGFPDQLHSSVKHWQPPNLPCCLAAGPLHKLSSSSVSAWRLLLILCVSSWAYFFKNSFPNVPKVVLLPFSWTPSTSRPDAGCGTYHTVLVYLSISFTKLSATWGQRYVLIIIVSPEPHAVPEN